MGFAADDNGRKFDGGAVAKVYYEIRAECRMGEAVDGHALTEEQSERQCLLLDALGEQLMDHGYCWDDAEQVWVLCGSSQ